MFYVYVLHSVSTKRFYIGSTQDITNRLSEHNSGEVKATRSYRPWAIVYSESFNTRNEAIRREYQIKRWKNPSYMVNQLGITL
jgi:putative endonuclease